jgi:hypothetical protein
MTSGGKDKSKVVREKVVIEPVLSIENLLKRPAPATLTPKQADKLERAYQAEHGVYGRGRETKGEADTR